MRHFLDDFIPLQFGRIKSRPVVHLLQQCFLAFVAHVDVIVRGCCRFDDMVAELDVLRCAFDIIRPFEQVADAFFAGFVSQNLVAAGLVSGGMHAVAVMERNGIAADDDFSDRCFVADCLVLLVFRCGFFAGILGFIREDAVECAVKQVRVDGLPCAFPVA